MVTVVFYDNLCSVCNYWVNWILENDETGIFYFAALSSDFANDFSSYFNYDFPKETIVVWNKKKGFLKKSDALIFIMQTIKPFSFQLKVIKLIPKFLRDIGYSIFAYFRRYIQTSKCKLPSPKHRKRFLSNRPIQYFLKIQKD